MLVESRVEEPKRSLLASLDALIDDAGDKGCEDRGRLGSAARGALLALDDDNTVESVGRDIRVATADAVVDTTLRDGAVGSVVILVSGVVLGKVTRWAVG